LQRKGNWSESKLRPRKRRNTTFEFVLPFFFNRKQIHPVSKNVKKSAEAYQQSKGNFSEPLYTIQTPNKMGSQWKQTADSKTIAAERHRTARTPSKLTPQP